MSAAHQVQALGIVRPPIEEFLQDIARVAVLTRGDIGRTNLAPDFMLSMRLVALHDLLEMDNRFRQSILRPRNATELIMRIQFI